MFQEFQSAIFSQPIEQNADVMSFFSPNGINFAYAVQCQLIILDTESQEKVQLFVCDYFIDSLGWSPDSELIYCCMNKQNSIQIWNLTNPMWRCKIMENPLAFSELCWAPDSLHLLVISEFHLKMTVWSLVSSITAVIENPKPVKNCISFSYCERYLAVAERRKCEDFISVYTCDTWEILKCFSVETKDLSGIYFSPSDLVIGVLEAFTEEPKVVFYSIDGRTLGKYVRSSLFGFTSLSWNSDGKLIAVGDYCGVTTILNCSNYEEITFYHTREVETIDCEKTTIYSVKCRSAEYEASGGVSSNIELIEVVKDKSLILPSLTNPPEKNKSKLVKYGIQSLKFSHCKRYLLMFNGSLPKLLFIYDLKTFMLSSVVIHHYKIKDVSWHPVRPLLAICYGSQNVNLWTPTCCISIWSLYKDELSILSVEWCSRKNHLLLRGKSYSGVLYLPDVDSEFCRLSNENCSIKL